MKKLGLVFSFYASCGLIGFAQTDGNARSDEGAVLAQIDGVKLTLGDLERKRPSGLFNARNSFYEAERKVVDEFIDEYLLERQAQREHLAVSELLERHVNGALPQDPSDEALRVYYEGLDAVQPYEAVKDQILQHLRERRMAKAKTAYLQSLRSQAAIEMRLKPPRAAVSLKDAQMRGIPDAPVVLVEYADYECPYCQQIQPALDRLLRQFQGKLAFVYKDVPLPMHPHAQKASEATHCAGKQGRYWEFHDRLYQTKKLDVPDLTESARALHLDPDAFETCLNSGEQAAVVKAQLAEGQSLGLQGTPTFFINGRVFSGALSYEQLASVVEQELHIAPADGTRTGSQ